MKYGFIKAACLSPEVRLADCRENTARIEAAVSENTDAQLLVFPELCLTG